MHCDWCFQILVANLHVTCSYLGLNLLPLAQEFVVFHQTPCLAQQEVSGRDKLVSFLHLYTIEDIDYQCNVQA